MSIILRDKKIVIFSPQPWSFLHISKHHYARVLSQNNEVCYLTAPLFGFSRHGSKKTISKSLFVVNSFIPLPKWIRFKFSSFYKRILLQRLRTTLQSQVGRPDVIIDFGCYFLFDRLDLFDASYKIFFPVDDGAEFKASDRGADLVLTVSTSVANKFAPGKCHFIDHGISDHFEKQARLDLNANKLWIKPLRLRVGYGGNLFLKFIDFDLLKQTIRNNTEVQFCFFGSIDHNPKDEGQANWYSFLLTSPNVSLHGQLSPDDLVIQYEQMDAFILCYKSDNSNYYADNSHKILEYLSMGKVTISTNISLYRERSDLLVMSELNTQYAELFGNVIHNLAKFNSLDQMNNRRKYALDRTYVKQVERINSLINNSQ